MPIVIIDTLFQRFIEKAPLPVMMRALLERTFHPERLDAWLDQTADAQYTRELLFSTLFELMSQVVCGVRRSVHDAYQATEHIATSVGAVYRKLARIEPTTVTELVRYSARESRAVMDALEHTRPLAHPRLQDQDPGRQCSGCHRAPAEGVASAAGRCLAGQSGSGL